MPLHERFKNKAFQEALIMLRHDFEGAKIQIFYELIMAVQ